jgi:Ni/Co efflux regulator RcnB
MRHILIAAAIALGAAATPAVASEAFSGAKALDQAEVSYTRHNREHRMWEIQRTQEMQQRRGRGYRGDGYGYRRGGPPRHAPAYGRRDRGYYRY